MHDMIRQGKALSGALGVERLRDHGGLADAERHHSPSGGRAAEYHLSQEARGERVPPLYHDIGMGLTTGAARLGPAHGKYRQGIPKDAAGAIPRMQFLVRTYGREKKPRGELEFVAKELGCTLAQLAIAWCAKNPHVSTVITGASRVEQVRENLKSLEVVPSLTAPVLERMEKIVAGHGD